MQFNYLKIRFYFAIFNQCNAWCITKDLEEFQLFARNIGHIVIKGLQNIMGLQCVMCNLKWIYRMTQKWRPHSLAVWNALLLFAIAIAIIIIMMTMMKKGLLQNHKHMNHPLNFNCRTQHKRVALFTSMGFIEKIKWSLSSFHRHPIALSMFPISIPNGIGIGCTLMCVCVSQWLHQII